MSANSWPIVWTEWAEICLRESLIEYPRGNRG